VDKVSDAAHSHLNLFIGEKNVDKQSTFYNAIEEADKLGYFKGRSGRKEEFHQLRKYHNNTKHDWVKQDFIGIDDATDYIDEKFKSYG